MDKVTTSQFIVVITRFDGTGFAGANAEDVAVEAVIPCHCFYDIENALRMTQRDSTLNWALFERVDSKFVRRSPLSCQ